MIRLLAKLLRILNSETDPSQISLAFCLALIAGFTPLMSPHNILVLFAALIIRVNLSSFILGVIAFSGLSYLLDPLFHAVGLQVLTSQSLEGMWTALYQMTPLKFDRFYNSVVMGSLLISIILAVPLFFLANMLILKYREHILAWVEKSKIMQMLKANKLYQAYQAVSGWRK